MAKKVGYLGLFNESLLRIPEALEWAERQNVDRLRRFFIENANIPLYCFSSGGASSALEYASLLYETNQGMSKALTPLMMASISDEALKRAKILIVTGDGDGCDEKYTSKRASLVNPQGTCAIVRDSGVDNFVVKTLKKVTNNWFVYNWLTQKDSFIATVETMCKFGLFYKAFTNDDDIRSKLNIDLIPSHCFTYSPRVEGDIPQLQDIKNFIVLYNGWSKPVATDFECKMIEGGFASVQLCDYRNFTHGRFIFMSKHIEDSAFVLFLTPREQQFAKDLILESVTWIDREDVFPKHTPIIKIETELDSPLASIDLMIKMQVCFNEIAKAFNDEPCDPTNPSVIDKRFPRATEFKGLLKMGALNKGNLQGTKGTMAGVDRRWNIFYDPNKSFAELVTINKNRLKKDVSKATVRKYIKEHNIDRRYDESMRLYNEVWKQYIKDSEQSIASIARTVKMSENTVKLYLSKEAKDIKITDGKVGMGAEHPTVKELRDNIATYRSRFERFRKIYDANPTLTAEEILAKMNISSKRKNLEMAVSFMQMKEFKYKFKNADIVWITTDKPQETAIPEPTEPQKPKAKETPTRKKKTSQEVRKSSDSLEKVDEELRKKLKRLKIKSLEELYEQRDAILKKEKERVAKCREVYANAKPLTWGDFSFRKTHTYDTSKVDCWSFNSNTDVRNGISLDVGNMSNGFGVNILGIDFRNSEVPYQMAIFKNDEASVAVQKEVADPSNKFFSNGLGMKRNYIYNKKYAPYRRDTQFENGKEMWCYEWMKWVVWEKVKQNKAFRDILLAIPQNAVIIEQAQKKSHIMWGCWNEELLKERKTIRLADAVASGKPYNSPKVKSSIYQVNCASKWVGENAMGLILTMAKLALNKGVQMPIDAKMLNDAKICWFGDVLVFTEQNDGSVTVEAKPFEAQTV